MPSISLVVPVYGVEKYIGQFLDSIRNQTFKDYELILVDDGSKDNCPQILDEYAKDDARCKVIHQENGGVSVARNTGLAQVTGKYVYIVDSDDWLEPTALEVLWNEAEKTNADLIYGDWVSEGSKGSVRQNCFPSEFVTEDKDTIKSLQYAVNSNNMPVKMSCKEFSMINSLGGAPWRGMIRYEVIEKNQLRFDPYVRGLGDDILFSLHLYQHISKISYIKKVIYHYRKLDTSYSHGFKANYLETVGRIYEKQEEFLKKHNQQALAWDSYYMRVIIYLQQGMNRYFKNGENPKSEAERYDEFCKLLKTKPYADAIKKISLKYLGSKRLKYTTLMLKLGLNKFYWNYHK